MELIQIQIYFFKSDRFHTSNNTKKLGSLQIVKLCFIYRDVLIVRLVGIKDQTVRNSCSIVESHRQTPPTKRK